MSPTTPRTPAGEILTTVTMDLFRVSGLILNAGDRLAAHLGLTGARWQILGAIVRADTPQTVAGIARSLGGNRQNVQRIVNDLHRLGYLHFKPNPRHSRANLLAVSSKGKKAYGTAMDLQAPWANDITHGIAMKDLEAFQRVVSELRSRLTSKAAPAGLHPPQSAG